MSVAAHLVPFVLAVAADPLVQVAGSATCPAPDRVAEQLERLLPPRPANVAPDLARVDADAGGVRVELRRADATLVGEKTLARNASCAEMAEAIGIVLAMWELPLHPGLVPPAVLAARREAPPASLATSPAVNSSGDAAPGRFRFEPGIGVRGLMPGPVPGVLIETVLRHHASGWGARLTIGGAWWTASDLAIGQVSWTRATAGLGPIRGWQGNRWFVDVHGQALAAALFAAGQGYTETRRPVAFDPGGGAGIRAGITVGTVRMWAELALAWWPIRRSLRVEGIAQMVDVPSLEPSLAIGGTFLTSR
jgi:hypothetical protein